MSQAEEIVRMKKVVEQRKADVMRRKIELEHAESELKSVYAKMMERFQVKTVKEVSSLLAQYKDERDTAVERLRTAVEALDG